MSSLGIFFGLVATFPCGPNDTDSLDRKTLYWALAISGREILRPRQRWLPPKNKTTRKPKRKKSVFILQAVKRLRCFLYWCVTFTRNRG